MATLHLVPPAPDPKPALQALGYSDLNRYSGKALHRLRDLVEAVLADRRAQIGLFEEAETPAAAPSPKPELLAVAAAPAAAQSDLAAVLSPSQVRAFLDCQARWWFKYGLGLREWTTSSLALGRAVHRAMEVYWRQRVDHQTLLGADDVAELARTAWREECTDQVLFDEGDTAPALEAQAASLAALYAPAAAKIEPAAIELAVEGEIAGVRVRGRIDLLDTAGRVRDLKTAKKKPSGVSYDYGMQVATYRQLCPGATGGGAVDTLVRTKSPQLVQIEYSVSEADIRATRKVYPLTQEMMREGLYVPNRSSFLCDRRKCAFWSQCEAEYGGTVKGGDE